MTENFAIMRKEYIPDDLQLWLDYYQNQANQVGYGGFRGTPYQRGAGLGSFFRSLFRMAIPVIKGAAKHIGKQALTSGSHVVADLVEGRPVLESLKQHGRAGTAALIRKADQAMNQQTGSGLGHRLNSQKPIKATREDVFEKKKRGRKKKCLS